MDAAKRDLYDHLQSYGRSRDAHWSFRGNAARMHGHAYFQYPAMIIPQMQAELIRAALAADPHVEHIYDPFVGSGTVLVEAMKNGLSFTGRDINPLAILLCRTKTIPHFHESLTQRVESAIRTARQDRQPTIEASFPNIKKWFRRDVALGLSRLQRAIRNEPALRARRFLWTALAETVRTSSNSRTSTFKLHLRGPDQSSPCPPIDSFSTICSRNLRHLLEQKEYLASLSLLKRGRYVRQIDVSLGDTACLDHAHAHRRHFDLLLTSPPYGDNVSTVTYGQHAYLPLQWIDFSDIDCRASRSCLETTHTIDHTSLGGSRRLTPAERSDLMERSPMLRAVVRRLTTYPPDRATRVLAFCRDLNRCLPAITTTLRPQAWMIWIVGSRCVGGQRIRLDLILRELLGVLGAKYCGTIHRTIPTKRNAVRNNISHTMTRESILLMRAPTD